MPRKPTNLPIPTESGKKGVLILCLDEAWLHIVKGAVEYLGYWWVYDNNTGNPKEAVETARAIYDGSMWMSADCLDRFYRVFKAIEATLSNGQYKPDSSFEAVEADAETSQLTQTYDSVFVFDGWVRDLDFGSMFGKAFFDPNFTPTNFGEGIFSMQKRAMIDAADDVPYLEKINNRPQVDLTGVEAAISALDLVCSPTINLDQSALVLAVETVAAAISALDMCCDEAGSGPSLEKAAADIVAALSALEVVAIAQSGDGVVNYKSEGSIATFPEKTMETETDKEDCCCGDGTTGLTTPEDKLYNEDDCLWAESWVDALLEMFYYLQYGIEVTGAATIAYYAGPALVWLLGKFRWFPRLVAFLNATVVFGLDPSDALTIGGMLMTELVYQLAYQMVHSGLSLLDIQQKIKDNRQFLVDLLCLNLDGSTGMTIDGITDGIIDIILPAALEEAAKKAVKDIISLGLRGRKKIILRKAL